MNIFAKRIVSLLPFRWQQNIKRKYFAFNIHNRSFKADEPDYEVLEHYISEGDWVIDVGANVGHYSLKFSKLVGASGRVFAIEPVPETFEILASNVQLFPFKNVTLFNVAASWQPAIVGMKVPSFSFGIKNYYRASITDKKTELEVYCVPIDALPMYNPVRMIKIDAEGHELQVLHGMNGLLVRDKPLLIVETSSQSVFDYLKEIGYKKNRLKDSPNYLFEISKR